MSSGPEPPQFGRRPAEAPAEQSPSAPATPAKTGDTSGADKRSAPRSRALLSGKLIVWDGQISSDCVIRDLSEKGARVKVAPSAVIPDEVGLLIVREGVLLECRLAWRRGEEAGLSILSRHDLAHSDHAAHRRARAIWLEVSPR